MDKPKQDIHFTNMTLDSIGGLHRFSHEAMATVFEIFIIHDDAGHAQKAAQDAFGELDRIEKELSRFIENSDISRINNLSAGESVVVGVDTFKCLELSMLIYEKTGKAFDVTIGSLLDCWLNDDKTLKTPSKEQLNLAIQNTGMNLLSLDADGYTVGVLADGVKIDVGGIGKGYAIDQMARQLKEWGINAALIHGGFSSVLAIGSPLDFKGWPVTISDPYKPEQILVSLGLKDCAISGSGLQQGMHIIDPRTAKPVEGRFAAWAVGSDAGIADGLSTAFMVMSQEQIEQYCSKHGDAKALLAGKQPGDIVRFGNWEGLIFS
ncbi:MAG: FAD:protein FMN transferase [Planctomycetes bacterium]|nr:FAD:protein FMN transferase [Planctomycetota bacterium]